MSSVATRIRHLPHGLLSRFRQQNSFLASVARLIGGSAAAQLIAVASTPFITRIYSPADFSGFGLFLSALGIANSVATLKYEAAIVSAQKACDATRLVFLSVAAAIPLGAAATGILFLMARSSLLGFGNLGLPAILVLFPTVVAYASFTALRQWYVRRSNYRRISQSLVFHSASRLVSQLAFGLAGATGIGLAMSETVSRLAISARMAQQSWPRFRRAARTLRWRELARVGARYSRFPRHATPSTLIDTVAHVLPVPLVVQCFGAVDAGAFVLVQRIIAVPVGLIGLAVADVFHRRLVEQRRSKPGGALRLLDKTALYLLALGAVPCGIVMLLGPPLLSFICGESWLNAGYVAAALAPLALAEFAISPISQCFSVYQAHRFKLIYDVLCLVASIVTLVGSAQLDISFITAVRAYATANVAVTVVYFLLMRYIVTRFHQDS